MRHFCIRLCALLAAMTVLSSCLKDSNESTTLYSDVAITQFTLGTLNRYTQTLSSTTGNDTIIKSTLNGSAYIMTIDHVGQRIYNATALPVGTDAKHVICSVTARNGGWVALQQIDSDSLSWHNSADSVDLSVPRTFRIYASDGSAWRDYQVTLNVSSSTGTDFEWQLVKSDSSLAWTHEMRLEAYGDSVRLSPRDSIVGRSTTACYMITDEGIRHSLDNGLSWNDEVLDDSISLLPDAATAASTCWSYAQAAASDYVLLVGQPRQDASTMRVWRKIENRKNGEGRWVFMPFDEDNNYPLPLVSNPTVAFYEGVVLCIGDDKIMRMSRDQGISWRITTNYGLPTAVTGEHFSMATDTQERLWLMTNSGELWLGTLR
ncbi:MAG: DUF6242 domain-containing protein [Prevotella sp.]|nr:DUF6242 domain-containing protein [Prevotella sp.]